VDIGPRQRDVHDGVVRTRTLEPEKVGHPLIVARA
jgi:hypothetical protein